MKVEVGQYRMRNGFRAEIREIHVVNGIPAKGKGYRRKTVVPVLMAWGYDEFGNPHFWGEDGRRGPSKGDQTGPFDLTEPYMRVGGQMTLFVDPLQPEAREVDAQLHQRIVEARRMGWRITVNGRDHVIKKGLVDHGTRLTTPELKRMLSAILDVERGQVQ